MTFQFNFMILLLNGYIKHRDTSNSACYGDENMQQRLHNNIKKYGRSG